MGEKLLRLPAVCERLGIKRATAYDWIKKSILPPPLKFGARISVWPESVIDKVVEDLKNGGSQ